MTRLLVHPVVVTVRKEGSPGRTPSSRPSSHTPSSRGPTPYNAVQVLLGRASWGRVYCMFSNEKKCVVPFKQDTWIHLPSILKSAPKSEMKVPMAMKRFFQKERPICLERKFTSEIGLLFQTVLIYVGNTPLHLSTIKKVKYTHIKFIPVKFKCTKETSDPLSNDVH